MNPRKNMGIPILKDWGVFILFWLAIHIWWVLAFLLLVVAGGLWGLFNLLRHFGS